MVGSVLVIGVVHVCGLGVVGWGIFGSGGRG